MASRAVEAPPIAFCLRDPEMQCGEGSGVTTSSKSTFEFRETAQCRLTSCQIRKGGHEAKLYPTQQLKIGIDQSLRRLETTGRLLNISTLTSDISQYEVIAGG